MPRNYKLQIIFTLWRRNWADYIFSITQTPRLFFIIAENLSMNQTRDRIDGRSTWGCVFFSVILMEKCVFFTSKIRKFCRHIQCLAKKRRNSQCLAIFFSNFPNFFEKSPDFFKMALSPLKCVFFYFSQPPPWAGQPPNIRSLM